MKYGLVYKSTGIYKLMLYLYYNGSPHERFMAVSELIPNGSSVVDICAGTDMLFRQLSGRNIDYLAADINPSFVRSFIKRGIRAVELDIRTGAIPKADYVIMCSSLYHFQPGANEIIMKMQRSAREKVIILEAVKSVGASLHYLLSEFAHWAGKVDNSISRFRFDRDSFTQFVNSVAGLESFKELPGGKDMLAVFSSFQNQ